MEEKLKRIINEKKTLVRSLRKELQYMKPGKLHVKKINGKMYFYEYSNGKEYSITKEPARIKELARYEMVGELLGVLEHNCMILDKAISKMKHVDEDRLDRLASFSNSPKKIYTKQQVKWLSEPYQRNPYHPEHLQYTTTNGIKMRSKSEQAIVNRLEANGIAYRAEPPLQLGSKTIYPDFVILLLDSEMVIWEHFGLMTDEAYRQNAQTKLDLYRTYGFVQHKNLICTYEEDIKSASDMMCTQFPGHIDI